MFLDYWGEISKEVVRKCNSNLLVAFMNEVGMKKATFYNKIKAYQARK